MVVDADVQYEIVYNERYWDLKEDLGRDPTDEEVMEELIEYLEDVEDNNR